MSTKIMAWSRCCIRRLADGDQARRWKAALTPYSAARLSVKIAAATRRSGAEAATTRAIPAGSETTSAT